MGERRVPPGGARWLLSPLGIYGMRGKSEGEWWWLLSSFQDTTKSRAELAPEQLTGSGTSKGSFNPFLQSTEGEQVWKCNREASKRAFRSFIWKAIGEKNIAPLNSEAEIYLFLLFKGELG